MLIELAQSYCEAINTGRVPTIESAWDYVCTTEAMKGVNEANKTVHQQCKTLLTRLPLDEPDIL